MVAGGREGVHIKTESGVPLNHNSVLSRTKQEQQQQQQHVNNVSVIQCGPALVNAVKVKSEPGGPQLVLPTTSPEQLGKDFQKVPPPLGTGVEETARPEGEPLATPEKQEDKPKSHLADVSPGTEKAQPHSIPTEDTKSKGGWYSDSLLGIKTIMKGFSFVGSDISLKGVICKREFCIIYFLCFYDVGDGNYWDHNLKGQMHLLMHLLMALVLLYWY